MKKFLLTLSILLILPYGNALAAEDCERTWGQAFGDFFSGNNCEEGTVQREEKAKAEIIKKEREKTAELQKEFNKTNEQLEIIKQEKQRVKAQHSQISGKILNKIDEKEALSKKINEVDTSTPVGRQEKIRLEAQREKLDGNISSLRQKQQKAANDLLNVDYQLVDKETELNSKLSNNVKDLHQSQFEDDRRALTDKFQQRADEANAEYNDAEKNLDNTVANTNNKLTEFNNQEAAVDRLESQARREKEKAKAAFDQYEAAQAYKKSCAETPGCNMTEASKELDKALQDTQKADQKLKQTTTLKEAAKEKEVRLKNDFEAAKAKQEKAKENLDQKEAALFQTEEDKQDPVAAQERLDDEEEEEAKKEREAQKATDETCKNDGLGCENASQSAQSEYLKKQKAICAKDPNTNSTACHEVERIGSPEDRKAAEAEYYDPLCEKDETKCEKASDAMKQAKCDEVTAAGGECTSGAKPSAEALKQRKINKRLKLPSKGQFDSLIKHNKITKVVDDESETTVGIKDGLYNLIKPKNSIVKIINYIIGSIALLYLVAVGVKFVISRGEEEALSEAKKQLGWLLLGLLIVSAAEYLAFNVFDPTNESGGLDGKDGIGKFLSIVQTLTHLMKYIAGGVALIAGIRSGYALIMGGDDDDTIQKEKEFIKIFILALVIILLAESITRWVDLRDGGGGINADSIVKEIIGITNYILGFIAAMALFMVVLSGLYYVISLGDDETTGKAKKMIIGSVIGLIVAYSAYTITRFII